MWNNTLFEATNANNPDLISVYVPEWPARMIITQPNKGITYILGTDYFGEAKNHSCAWLCTRLNYLEVLVYMLAVRS